MTLSTDDELRSLLTDARVIAVVGMSDRPGRISKSIGLMLRDWGYTIYPVNPQVHSDIDGLKVYETLAEVPEPIDIVNVFRLSAYLPGVVEEAIAVGAKAVWAQLGIWSDEAEQMALAAGLPMVQDRCIKIDYMRLIGW